MPFSTFSMKFWMLVISEVVFWRRNWVYFSIQSLTVPWSFSISFYELTFNQPMSWFTFWPSIEFFTEWRNSIFLSKA
jgi:hypothetical protein